MSVNQSQIEDIRRGGINSFEMLYLQYYGALVSYARLRLKDEDQAKDIVQQVFLHLWEKRESIDIKQSLGAYLMTSVKNACLNSGRHDKVKNAYQQFIVHRNESISEENTLEVENLKEKMLVAIDQLPEQCRKVFKLSRLENKSYKEIAGELAISVKTVEAHMGKALSILRAELKDYMILLLILFR